MVCCSANPRPVRRQQRRRFVSPNFAQKPSYRLRAALELRSECHDPDKTSPHRRCASRVVSTLRDNGRDHYASMRAKPMKHHDLNPAILYAVQLGFSLFSFVFCLTCVADLVEPNIGLCSGHFRATRHPHQGRLRRPQSSRFRSIFQALFCLNTSFVSAAMLRVIPVKRLSLQRARAVRQ
jgi:hypothetical protein